MNEICGDDRFEIIEAAKNRLIDATNIEDRPDEMAVIDSVLFRIWQMGWLPGCGGADENDKVAREFRFRAAEGYSFNRDNVADQIGVDMFDFDDTWELDEVLWCRLAELIDGSVAK